MRIQEMCRLLGLKYQEQEFGFGVQIRIYDDGSGVITKHPPSPQYEEGNNLFEFNNTQTLEEHLNTK